MKISGLSFNAFMTSNVGEYFSSSLAKGRLRCLCSLPVLVLLDQSFVIILGRVGITWSLGSLKYV